MKTIQVVMDERLLEALDQVAERDDVNRSELVRASVKDMLRRRRIAELERIEREGYERVPDDSDDARLWQGVASWPDD